jgi:hypothetical protein
MIALPNRLCADHKRDLAPAPLLAGRRDDAPLHQAERGIADANNAIFLTRRVTTVLILYAHNG